jgi:hypothetical protein
VYFFLLFHFWVAKYYINVWEKKMHVLKHHSDIKMLDIITMPWNTRLGLKWHFCITHLCMKFNFKCSKTIKISYAQTHRLCTYKVMLRNPFLTFVDEAMLQIWLAPFPLPFELLTKYWFHLEKNDLSRFSSQVWQFSKSYDNSENF